LISYISRRAKSASCGHPPRNLYCHFDNVDFCFFVAMEKLSVFARPTHLGRSTAVSEAYMMNDQGKRVAQSTGTFFYTGEPAIKMDD
jgi:acyl-coenzyme A thioesterase PaaI-like protein